MKIPQTNWRQTNRSDILGSLWSSFNLDLTDNLGVTRVSPRTLLTTDNITDLGIPCAFEFFDTLYWAIAGSYIFNNSGVTNGNFTKDATGSSPTSYSSDESDLELFNGFLYTSATGGLFKKTANGSGGGAWSADLLATLETAFPHLLLAFGDRLYVTDEGHIVHSLDDGDSPASPSGTPNTVSYTLDLSIFGGSAKNTISCMRATTQYIWIGTINRNQGKARVYYWDGAQPTPNGFVELDSSGALAMVIKDDVPYIMDTNGALLQFNGGTFKEIARLPYDKFVYLDNVYDIDHTDRPIHPNGMTIVDDKINVLVNNLNFNEAESENENLPAGIWEFDERIGLYHKLSLSYHAFSAGSVEDYGQNKLSKVGAITHAKNNSKAANTDGHMLIGAQYFSDATTVAEGIWTTNPRDTKQKYGYLVTTKTFSANLKDNWQKVYTRIKRLLASTDKIVVKYRTTEVAPVTATITWVNTTSFTVTAANVPDLAVGDEVEVLQGDGSGQCSHVTAITGTTTYTVTVDETYTGATTNTAKARFQKWIKSNVTISQTEDYFEFPLGATTPWIQIKVCFRFTGKNEMYDILLINEKT